MLRPGTTSARRLSIRLARLVLPLAGLLIVPKGGVAQLTPFTLSAPPKLDRCLRATPALTYSAAPGAPESGDSTWAILALFDDGSVRRPLLPPRHSNYSRWQMRHDTLDLRVFDGLVGWDVAAAVVDSGAYAGIATYLTDVRVAGASPHRIPVALRETVCPNAPHA
jgi:hypothetical protein